MHKHKWSSIGTWYEGTPQGEFHVEGYVCDCGKRRERREQEKNNGGSRRLYLHTTK